MALPPEIRYMYLQTTARIRNGEKVRFAKAGELPNPVIKAVMRQVPGTTTSENSHIFLAETEVDGQHYEGTSRRGASFVLARKLKEAGIPDQPLSVWIDGIEVFRWGSFYEAAENTFGESAKMPLRMGKYVDISTRIGTEE